MSVKTAPATIAERDHILGICPNLPSCRCGNGVEYHLTWHAERRRGSEYVCADHLPDDLTGFDSVIALGSNGVFNGSHAAMASEFRMRELEETN
ncbi:MAG: hypothetical protein F4Z40_03700 [Chloroflexi bacterium]|nr:hypothetical protein [Chloroflexota bacterium]